MNSLHKIVKSKSMKNIHLNLKKNNYKENLKQFIINNNTFKNYCNQCYRDLNTCNIYMALDNKFCSIYCRNLNLNLK